MRISKLFPPTRLILAAVAAASAPIGAAVADDEAGINAALLYHNYCSVCHGDRGDGNSRAKNSLVPPPRDFTAGPLPRDYMIAVVADGKPGTAMVGWKTQLGDKEVAAVVDYVIDTFMTGKSAFEAKPPGVSGTRAHGGREKGDDGGRGGAVAAAPVAPASLDMSLPFPDGLVGDATAGKAFYMGNCATCHGEKGDGKGPRAYFINPVPRDFLLDGSRLVYNRPALYRAISKGSLGTEMPAWEKVLTAQQIADVGEIVFRQFIHPEADTASNAE